VGRWSPGGALGGERATSEADDFEGADDAAGVLAVDGLEGGGVALAEFVEEVGEGGGFEFATEVVVGGGGVAEALEEGVEIKAGTAAEDGEASAGVDVGDGGVREAGELGGVEVVGELTDVDEVVRDTAALGGGGFGGAEVEAAIDLHGIDGDDFGVELFGEAKRDGGFTDGGGTGEEEAWRRRGGSGRWGVLVLRHARLSALGCRSGEEEHQEESADNDSDADELGWGDPAAEIVNAVVAAEALD
jgi:hypothetical protein